MGGRRSRIKVLEIGSRNVNGGLRTYARRGWRYVGVDVVEGPGVDIVLEDPYKYPFCDGQFNATVSTSAFEHVEFFWLSFLEMVRVTAPGGFIFLTVPSELAWHGDDVPPDSWRFLQDAGSSLERWGHRNGFSKLKLVQTFINNKTAYNQETDCVMIFAREQSVNNDGIKILETVPAA